MNDALRRWRGELIRCAQAGTAPSHRTCPFPVQPVLIVAGSCREEGGDTWERFVQRLETLLARFHGRVISGGTRAGVCREIGRISAEQPKEARRWTSVGYLPRDTAASLIDDRYDEHVFTDGAGFSEIEPLQYWSDILASGISPTQVVLFRYGGGDLADFEEQLAGALGATCTPVTDAVDQVRP